MEKMDDIEVMAYGETTTTASLQSIYTESKYLSKAAVEETNVLNVNSIHGGHVVNSEKASRPQLTKKQSIDKYLKTLQLLKANMIRNCIPQEFIDKLSPLALHFIRPLQDKLMRMYEFFAHPNHPLPIDLVGSASPNLDEPSNFWHKLGI